MSNVPSGEMAIRLYKEMRHGDVPAFFLPEAYVYDCDAACAFLRSLADEMETLQKEKSPDGLPF